MEDKKLYTHDKAMQIIELFEDILIENNIGVPSPEDDERDEDDIVGLYGSTYSDLLDSVENMIIEIIGECKSCDKVVTNVFSGTV